MKRHLAQAVMLLFLCFPCQALPFQCPCGILTIDVPDPNLFDFMRISYDQFNNPLIIYNPILLRQAPLLLQQFFWMHECGHHCRGHLAILMQQGSPLSMAWTNVNLELDADCFAASNVPHESSQAAYDFFRKQGPVSPHPAYPNYWQRSDVIAQCAQ